LQPAGGPGDVLLDAADQLFLAQARIRGRPLRRPGHRPVEADGRGADQAHGRQSFESHAAPVVLGVSLLPPDDGGAHRGDAGGPMSAHKKLRELLERKNLLLAPGCFDGLSARLVEQAGFDAVYLSGGAVARSAALPDLGLMTMSEVIERARQVTSAVKIP